MVPAILQRSPEFLAPIAVLYGQRLERFGAWPPGVLWRNEDGRRPGFEILVRRYPPRQRWNSLPQIN